jgi:hypothetical protein
MFSTSSAKGLDALAAEKVPMPYNVPNKKA